MHDFIDKQLGKAIPYGVYDIGRNEGWVNVGIDHDTAEFAVNSIRRWWRRMGASATPASTPDDHRGRRRQQRLPHPAVEVGTPTIRRRDRTDVSVCHYPPGTSKWNKIEHRLFCHITQNWRGRPLTSRLRGRGVDRGDNNQERPHRPL